MANQCCRRVFSSGSFRGHLCTKPATVERDGKFYCRTHDPEEEAKRHAKRSKKMEEEWAAQRAAIAERKRVEGLHAACLATVRAIALGHDDPRALAHDVLAKFAEPIPTPASDA